MEDVQEKTGKPITPQPFLAMLHMVVKRILQAEVSTNQLESLRSILSSLRSADPEVLQQQKDKYDTLVEQSKERMMGEEVMEVMYQVGIDVGIYLSKYQKPTEIIPGLRSKILWDLADLDHNTAKMINKLKENWKTVYEEGLELKTKEARWMEDKRLIETGSWNQLSFIGTSNLNIFSLSCFIFCRKICGQRGQSLNKRYLHYCPHHLLLGDRDALSLLPNLHLKMVSFGSK